MIHQEEIEQLDLTPPNHDVTILPSNYLEQGNHAYSSTALSLKKYAQKEIDIDFITTPESLLEQRAGDWISPVLLLTSSAIANNPDIISLTITMLENYLKQYFEGKQKPQIKTSVIYEKTELKKTIKIDYEGSIEGLGEIREAIQEVAKK